MAPSKLCGQVIQYSIAQLVRFNFTHSLIKWVLIPRWNKVAMFSKLTTLSVLSWKFKHYCWDLFTHYVVSDLNYREAMNILLTWQIKMLQSNQCIISVYVVHVKSAVSYDILLSCPILLGYNTLLGVFVWPMGRYNLLGWAPLMVISKWLHRGIQPGAVQLESSHNLFVLYININFTHLIYNAELPKTWFMFHVHILIACTKQFKWHICVCSVTISYFIIILCSFINIWIPIKKRKYLGLWPVFGVLLKH